MNRTYIVKVILKVCKSFPRDENSTKRLIYGDFHPGLSFKSVYQVEKNCNHMKNFNPRLLYNNLD